MVTESTDDILRKLAVRVDALRRAMDTVMAGSTPDRGKWVAFKNFARAYNTFATQYREVTGDSSIPIYNLEKIKGSTDTVWPVQKEIFDIVYANTLALSGLLSGYDVGISGSISEIQDLLTARLRKIIFAIPDKESEVKNAIEALLVGAGFHRPVDYDREVGGIKFSGREFIPDFAFHSYNLAL
jgi:hypothetical protein